MNREALVRATRWPKNLPVEKIIEICSSVKLFVDFDETLINNEICPPSPFQTICGKSLLEFLSTEPFVVQTWSSDPEFVAAFFLNHNPPLPQPLLIIAPPGKDIITDSGKFDFAKDFEKLGITGVTIVDDWATNGGIHAPGCTVILPR